MTLLRAHNIAVSLDGFATGEGQSMEAPFGHAGMRLMEWYFPTNTFQSQTGHRERVAVDSAAAPDDVFARRSWEGIGAEIMGIKSAISYTRIRPYAPASAGHHAGRRDLFSLCQCVA